MSNEELSRAALAGAAAAIPEGWKTIETAPKGRKVLAGYLNRANKWRTVVACYYLPQTLELSDDWNGDDEGDGFAPEGWYEECENSETINFTEEPPTHWMPLPAAPGAAAPLASTDAAPAQPSDAQMIDWIERQHYTLSAVKERDGDEVALWWQVTDGRRSISGHPLSSVREAIRSATALAKAEGDGNG